MYLLRSTLYSLHVADVVHPDLCTCALVGREGKTHVTFDANSSKCQIPAGSKSREQREREDRVCHGFVDSINGNNATSVRRFIDDAIELRFSSPPNSPLSRFILFLPAVCPRFHQRPTPVARSNCQFSCNDLEKASFERNQLISNHSKTTYEPLPTYGCLFSL